MTMAFGHKMAAAWTQVNARNTRFAESRRRRRAILREFSYWCRLQQARIAQDLNARLERIQHARELNETSEMEWRR
jgi:hypothetical protein